MLNTSNQFKSELYNDNRDYLCYADITLADGTVLNLENENIWTDSFSIEDAVSGTGSFDIGAAIINKLTLSINNIYEAYSEYDFTDAVVVPYVGLELSDGTVEKIRKGVFTVDEASYDGSLITLSCLDNMYKLDYAYTESSLSYPATLGEVVRDICYVCGVTLLTTTFFNSSYRIQNRPDDQALTCRQVLSWAAQIACSWARFDVYGRLCLGWYDLSVFEKNTGLNGGIFDAGSPYQTGDTASGGTFNPWTVGDEFNGGTFKELNSYHHIYSMSAMQICTDDVVITGLKVTESFEETETEKVQSYLFGTEGYVIAIEGNDLIQKGKAEAVARAVGGKVVGMRFRPFDVSALNDPSIEAGDPVIVTDRKQRSYQSYITSATFKAGNYQQIRCSAETPSRNSAQRFSEATRNIVKARLEASRRISDYDKAMQMLTSLITQSFGVFKTEEKLEDGSTIFYLHNKPNLNESMTIWKMTADAFAVTTDGGKTWNAGMDSQGNVVVNVLSAIGINAEWINTGELVVKDEEGNITLLANVDTGRVIINAESVSISGRTVQDIVSSVASNAASSAVNNQTQEDIFNKLTNNGQVQGLYIQDGQLYISFNYAKGGILTLGGNNNVNGILKILDASGKQIGSWDKDGISVTKGKIRGPEIDVGGKNNSYGIINVYDGNDQLCNQISGSGMELYNDGSYTGVIGTSKMHSHPEMKSIRFGLAHGHAFMCWGYQEEEDGLSIIKLAYYSPAQSEYAAGLHVEDKLFMDYNRIYFGDGYSGYITNSGDSGITLGASSNIYFSIASSTKMNINYSNIDVYSDLNMHSNDILNQSDERLKNNIEESEEPALGIINDIQTFSYDWIETGKHEDIDFIAQQIDTVAPGLVHVDGETGVYSINKAGLIPYLVKAVQELTSQVQELKEEIADLKGEKIVSHKKMKRKWKPEKYTDSEKLDFVSKLAKLREPEEAEPVPIVEGQ